jgi:microcystin-dependent protein
MDPMLGEVRIFAGNYAPDGWALCDGSLLIVSANQYLFSLIGKAYGGDGINTFALPDLRGRLLVQTGQGSGLSSYPFAAKGGQEKVSLSVAETPVHRHAFTVGAEAATTNQPAGNFLAAPVDTGNPGNSVLAYLPYQEGDATLEIVPLGPATLVPSGSAQPLAHENRQPYLPISYIIAIRGVYPAF